jgi:hypothetical protein
MKWFKFILIGLLLVVCVVIAGVAVSIRYLPETDLIKNAVTNQLRGLTGNEVGIASIKATPSFPDVVSFQATGITVTSREGKELLSIDRLTLTPSLSPLLNREIAVKSVVIEGVRTTVTREPDGSFQQGFLPIPVSSAGSVSGQEGTPATGETGTPSGVPSDTAAGPHGTPGMKWSIESVRLVDGQVAFVDQGLGSGKKSVLSVKGLNATLTQEKPGNAFTIELKGSLGDGSSGQGTFEVKGRIGLTPDLSALKHVSAVLTSGSIPAEPFRQYLPFLRPSAAGLRLSDTRCGVSWERGLPASFSLDTRLAGSAADPAAVKLHAEGSAAPDLSGLEQVTAVADTDRFPLTIVKDYLPPEVPLNPDKGLLSAKLQGDRQKNGDWRLSGTLDLDDLVPVGFLAGIAKQVAMKSRIRLESQSLVVEDLEILGTQRLASVQGTISNPFSGEVTMDLTARIAAESQWLKNFGIRWPDGFQVTGPLPVQARMRGTPAALSLDFTGDLSGAAIQWAPFLEKTRGDKATVAAKGDILPAHEQGNPKTYANMRVRVDLPSLHVRMKPESAWITGWGLALDAGVAVRGKTVDAKDAALALKRGSKHSEVIAITANVENLTSAHAKFKGTAHALLDRETMAVVHEVLPPNLVLTGEARPKAVFSGTAAEGGWTVDASLTTLGIEVDKSFRKPAGAVSALKASGKWSKEGLFLDRGNFTLPGISASGRGLLSDHNGKPGELTLDLKRADLKDLGKFIPPLADLRASGPVEAEATLKPSPKGLIPHASVRLIAVEYAPEKAAWSIRKLHGTASMSGNSLAVPDLAGQLQGAIEAPLQVKLTLDNAASLKDTNGKLSLEIGKGRIKADRLRNILNQTRLLVGSLLDPQTLEKPSDFFDLEGATGDFDIKSGTAQTSNLRLKASDFNLGAVGSLRLADLHLDALVALHTVLVTNQSLGKIPEVRKAVKKYEGLLKITGLDKELKRVGIDTSQEGQEKEGEQGPVKTPVKVIVKVTGNASSPRVTPVLETTLAKDTAERLKSLTEP